ncbi:hypothetical protein AMECASPLE_032527 [Ameca splendens]|uniref:Uncharacterized protein n=1 Tax=Ameca splendens TaxID=208324 RepID=A0ABV0YIT3_9TELE
MLHQMPSCHQTGMRFQPCGWEAKQNQEGWIENRQPANLFQGEIHRLGSLLEIERARWFEENQKVASLEKELEDTKFEWQRQKKLKEMYINKGKETKRELMRVEKFTDPATLSPAVIASKVHSNMKYEKKKMLQKDFEQLKVAHIVNEEAFISEIQAEKDKNNVLQQELDRIKICYEELRSKCKDDNGGGTLQVDTQRFYEEKIKQDQQLLENLRAEKDNIQQKMSKEIAFLQETEKSLQSELDQVKVSYQELNGRYETDVSALRQQAEAYRHEMNRDKEANLERAKNDLQLINDLKAEKDILHQKMAQEFAFLEQQSAKTVKHLQSELEQVKALHQELKNMNEMDVFALRQQAEIFHQELDKEIKAHSQKMRNNLKIINKLGAEKEALHQQLTDLQQLHSGCEVKYETELKNLKAELQDRDELVPPKRKMARHQEPSAQKVSIPVKTIPVPASMDLDHLLDETLSEAVEITDASPMEVNEFVEEMLRKSSILDLEPMEETDLSVETLPEKKETPDSEPMEAAGSQQDPSVWKKIRHTLGLKKPKKWKKSKSTSKISK